MRAGTYSDSTHGWHEYLQGQSTEDLDLLIDLASEPDSLSNAQFYRAYYLCRVMFRRMENDYYQFQNGTFEPETWEAYVGSFREDTFQNPAVRAMWALQSGYFDPSFVKYMQDVVSEASDSRVPRLRDRFGALLREAKAR